MSGGNGSAIGTIVGAIVGAIAAYFTAGVINPWTGAMLGAAIGGAAGGAIDPPKGPKIQGPRLNDLTVQSSSYGAVIPRVYGTIALWGNIFWLENNQIKEYEKLTVTGGKGFGSTATDTTIYTYTGTFALGLCEGPIIGIRRIWIGPKLFYDIGSTDVDVLIQSIANSIYFKLYLGTDTQQADPRMQATLGVANVPAYRGLAYLVFMELPLADYGNSLALAQIKVEVVMEGSEGYTFEHISNTATGAFPRDIALYENYVIIANYNDSTITIYNAIDPSAPYSVSGISLGAFTRPNAMYVFGSTLVAIEYTGYKVIMISLLNPEAPIGIFEYSFGFGHNPVALVGNENFMFIALLGGEVAIFPIGSAAPFDPFVIEINYASEWPIGLSEDNNWFYAVTSVSTFEVWDMTDIWNNSFRASTTALGWLGSSIQSYRGFVYITNAADEMVIYDVSDATKAYAPVLASTTLVRATASPTTPQRIAFSGDMAFVSTRAGLYAYNISDPTAPVFVAVITTANDNNSHSIVTFGNYIAVSNYGGAGGVNTFDIFQFLGPTLTNDAIPLSEIVAAESLKSELITAADIDVTSLTPLVRGYRISQVGAIRGGLDPLRAAWPFDAVQSGYKIKYILRGGASVATIPDTLLDARAAGEKPGVQIANIREMDSILPRKVSIKFFDVNREYDTGDQYAERINTDAVNVQELELSIVLTAEEAAQKAQILLYMYWLERYDIAFKLPPSYAYLEPADIITITSDNATYVVRLTSINYTSDGRLECTAKYHLAAVYVSYATGEEGQSTGAPMRIPGNTIYRLLDIPLLQDNYDQPGFILAMTGPSAGWTGGVLFVTDDNGQLWTELQAITPPGATMGYATDSLAIHDGLTIDSISQLTVQMYQGTLSSVTEAQMFGGTNWFAYGADGRWEIIAAQNAVLQGDGTYLLSTFLRGQVGTEWTTELHETNDSLVYLSSSTLAFMPINSNMIGVERNYRGISAGKTIDTDSNLPFTYNGVNLKPLSPKSLSGSRHPTTRDWTLTWVRRSRYAGWRGFIDAPLGEATEAYEIEIWSGTASATGEITVAWDMSDDPSVTGYYVYWATSSHAAGPYSAYTYSHDVTDRSITSYTITGLNPGTTYYINMSTHGAGGHDAYESGLVGEITKVAGVLSNRELTPLQAAPIFLALKRTLTATSQTVNYTSAQQVTDFGSNQATLYVKIYQMSATVGRGYPLIAIISRA